MDLKIGPILALVVAAMLLASLIPSILSMMYNIKTDTTNKEYGKDRNWSAIATDLNATNSASVDTIWKILPLFVVIGGLGILFALIRLGYL